MAKPQTQPIHPSRGKKPSVSADFSSGASRTSSGVKIIPLGGLGEVGKNMMVIEDRGKILIIDMGLRMPDEDMPGIDYIIPNIVSLRGREKDIVGILITHGHLDHI